MFRQRFELPLILTIADQEIISENCLIANI
jgi:hypothetical protein